MEALQDTQRHDAAVSAPGDSGSAGTLHVLSDLMDQAVARFGHRPALDFMGRTMTYKALGAEVDRATAGLVALGVEPGVRVGLCLPNTPFSVILYYAVLKAGGTVVNFNPLYTPRELLAQVRDSGTTMMVVLDLERIYRPVASIATEAGLRHIIVCPMGRALPTAKAVLFNLLKRKEIARPGRDAIHVPYAALLSQDGPRPTPARADVDPDAVAVLQYTGGTTGQPKGAMLTHRNLLANAEQVHRHAGGAIVRDGEEKVLAVIPFFHVFAMTAVMNLAIRSGAQMILLPQYKLDQLVATIERCKPTIFSAVPTIYGAIVAEAEKRRLSLSSINLCISGGAPLPQEVHRDFEALTGCRLAEGYGLSEASPVVSCNPLDGSPSRPGSAGVALPDTVIEIRDPEEPTRLLGPNEKGEVCVRGPQVMAGYWQRPDDTAAVMVDGALRTGDIGYLDDDGFLFLVDRIKDLILCSGYNVYPRVIEEALYEHDSIKEAIVIAVPDEYRGERPKAFVTLKDGVVFDRDDLDAFLAERLSKIELPKDIEVRDSLPKTLIGKLSRKELVAEERERAAARTNETAKV